MLNKIGAVPIIAPIIALFLFWKFGLTLKFLFSFIFACALTVIAFADFDHQIIPDVVTLPRDTPILSLAAFAYIFWGDEFIRLLFFLHG